MSISMYPTKQVWSYHLTVNAIMCEDCRSIIWSIHQHDFRYCKCQKIFIDGGRNYTRIGYSNKRPRTLQIRINEYDEIDLIQLVPNTN